MFNARVLFYEVWGNETDGFEVNNLFEIAKIRLNGDYRNLTDKQILSRLNGKPAHNTWSPYSLNNRNKLSFNQRYIESDNNICSEDIIEVVEKKTGKPVGRIELSDNG